MSEESPDNETQKLRFTEIYMAFLEIEKAIAGLIELLRPTGGRPEDVQGDVGLLWILPRTGFSRTMSVYPSWSFRMKCKGR